VMSYFYPWGQLLSRFIFQGARASRPTRTWLPAFEELDERVLPSGTAPHVTVNPANLTINAAHVAAFTAAATGAPAPTVQWQVSTDGGQTFKDVAGASSATLTFTAPSASGTEEFRAVFTNSLGKATTKIAVVTVDAPVTITKNPASVTAKAGQKVTF